MRNLTCVIVLGLSLVTSVVRADEPDVDKSGVTPAGETISYSDASSVRGVAKEWMILPEGQVLGAELRFLTSKPSLGAAPLEFSDVAILGLNAKVSVAGKAELFASVDLLPKQPSWTDEKVWQGASLGLRGQLGRRQVAISARASGGPMLGDLGYWGAATATVNARKRLHSIMTFEGALNATGTYLMPSAEMRDPAWLAEGSVAGSVLFRDPYGKVGAWVGVGYGLPIAHKGTDPVTGEGLDPQPRIDLHVGGVVSLVDAWDLFADYAIIDRGDMGAMATRLPILDGGFDQRQVIIGLNYHVKAKNEMSASALIQH
jgi:hypothetical protein